MNKISKEMVKTATAVIIHAGNARISINRAIEALEENKNDLVDELILEAETQITEAHRIQTEILQSEARGEEVDVSFLWIHAQDSLMSAITELRTLEMIRRMYRKTAS